MSNLPPESNDSGPKKDNSAPPKRKAAIFTEETKQQFVSHWDWDYLSTEDLEKINHTHQQNDS